MMSDCKEIFSHTSYKKNNLSCTFSLDCVVGPFEYRIKITLVSFQLEYIGESGM